MTTYPVAGERAFIRGFGYAMTNMKSAVEQVMERGIIERDGDFLAAMDAVTPTTQGNALKYTQAFSKYSDILRKTVSWHVFRLQALEPGFKPSPLAKLFVKDVPGRSVIEMSKDYADAMTEKTQFVLRAHGKPQAFVGGQARRAVAQFKPWMVNYGAYFGDMLKSKDPKAIGRMLAMIYFVGGPTALLGGDLLYNLIRNQVLKRTGYVLPSDTGFQQVANMTGYGEVIGDVDLLSLRSPLGLPQEPTPQAILNWAAGPTLSTIGGVANSVYQGDGDLGKTVKSAVSAISPEARALLDAAEEYRMGGVKSPEGRRLATRSMAQIIIRGLDLSPSVKIKRWQYRTDVINALKSGHPATARELLKQARTKGILFGTKDVQQMKSQATHYLRGQRIQARDPESIFR